MLYVKKRDGVNPMGSFQDVFSKNQFLVVWVVKYLWRSLKNNRADTEEAIQVGNIALWKAYESFDPDKKVKFSTYATAVIFRDVNSMIKDSRPGIVLKKYVYNRVKKGTIDPDTLPRKSMSIDTSIKYSDVASIPATAHVDIDNRDSVERISELIKELPDKERAVVLDHLLLGKTYKELAAEYGCSQETIRNWYRKAICHVKRHMGVLDVGDPVQQRRRSRQAASAARRHGCQRVHGKNGTLATVDRP